MAPRACGSGYWFDRPVSNAELKACLKGVPYLDWKVFSVAQAIYTAGPIFEGATDPIPSRFARIRGLAGDATAYVPTPSPGEDRERRVSVNKRLVADHPEDVVSAVEQIPNDKSVDWHEWNRIGMAIFAATEGSSEGLETFEKWTDRNQGAGSEDSPEARWANYENSPPDDVGAGTLIKLAREANPKWIKPSDPPPSNGSEFELDAAHPEGPEDWKCKLQRTAGTDKNPSGSIIGSVTNCLIALRHAPEWRGVLGYDEFKAEGVYLKPPPYSQAEPAGPADYDRHAILLLDWLNNAGIPIRSERQAWACLDTVAREVSRRFHPVRDYLRSLKWDGTSRLDTVLMDHLGAEDDEAELNRAFGARTLIGAVARIMEPGCQLRTVLCLEGDQDIGKSKFFKAIVPNIAWHSETCPSLDNKTR